MRKLKLAVITLLLLVFALSASGCTIINPQKMWRVKGTYVLKTHTTTSTVTGETTDHVANGEVAYLIVTGTSKGSYIYKNEGVSTTRKSVSLRYVYSTEEPNKVAYVYYKFEGDVEERELGVTRNGLNKSSQQLVPNNGSLTMVTTERYSWEKESFLTNFWWVNIKLGTSYK